MLACCVLGVHLVLVLLVYALLPGSRIFAHLSLRSPFSAVYAPCRDAYLQKSNVLEAFFRCLCSPAGGAHFLKIDISKPFLIGGVLVKLRWFTKILVDVAVHLYE